MAENAEDETGASGSGDEEDLFAADDDTGKETEATPATAPETVESAITPETSSLKAESATPATASVKVESAATPATASVKVESAATPATASKTVGSTTTPATASVKAESSPASGSASATGPGVDQSNVATAASPRSIPRKGGGSGGAAPPKVPSGSTKAVSTVSPATFGLPNGVTIPVSVTKNASVLQGRLLETLRSLPINLINDALTEYDDAVQIKGEAIRNHGAYLYGVIKRYIHVQERAASGEGQGALPMGPELTPAIHTRLQRLVAQNFCTQEEMNDKVQSKIRMLSEKDALFAIDELASVERRQIRNFGSYFMGILNRYMRGESGGGKKAGGKQQPQPSRPQNNDRRRDDRVQQGPPGNSFRDQNQSYKRQRGRSHSFDGPDRRNKPFDKRGPDNRDLSRYQDARLQPFNNPGQQQYPPYPGSQQQPPQQQHQQQPPHYPGQQHQQPPAGYPGQQPPMGYPGQQQQPPAYQQQPLPYGAMPGNPPPPPPRSAPASLGGLPRMNPYQPQQSMMQRGPAPPQAMYPPDQSQFVPRMGGNPAPSSFVGNPQSNPQHQYNQPAPGMRGDFSQQQQQQPYGAPVVYSNHTQQHLSPMHGRQEAQQSYPPPSPNVGQQNLNYGAPAPTHPGQMQGSFPQQGPASSGGWQSSTPVGLDILGLADKAASVVQALASQNKLQMQQGAPMTANPPYGSMAPTMGAPQQYGNTSAPYSMSNGPPRGGGGGGAAGAGAAKHRSTTASLSELPAMVQYAIQNLQATRQIDGPLDDGMLGMVKDLPEELALTAFQKFSSIDKKAVRNKTAYLAGVLRRELERINRR